MVRLVRLGDIATVSQGLGMSGRAAGAHAGDWHVNVVSVGDIQDDRLSPEDAQPVAIQQNANTERHLLLPDDVVLTARSSAFKAALVPASIVRTMADASLNIVRAREPGVGPYLWWFVTSSSGRRRMQDLMSGATVLALSAAAVADVRVPLPEGRELYRIADIVEASERAYAAGLEATQLRRSVFRDALLERFHREAEATGAHVWR